MTEMRKFTRHRTREQLEAECRRRCWPFNAVLHDTRGHDHVSMAFVHGNVYGTAVVNVFNGLFFGELEDGTAFHSSKTTHENEPWFQALLEAVYL